MTRDEFAAMKAAGQLPYGQVPALDPGGGQPLLAQSSAILRYVATVGGLHPASDALAAGSARTAAAGARGAPS